MTGPAPPSTTRAYTHNLNIPFGVGIDCKLICSRVHYCIRDHVVHVEKYLKITLTDDPHDMNSRAVDVEAVGDIWQSRVSEIEHKLFQLDFGDQDM